MDLLKKFENVEVKADTRISQSDRIFCEAHQAAYDLARSSLAELEFFWEDMRSQQRELLAPADASADTYLTTYGEFQLSSDKIRGQLQSLHALFIDHLVSHFSKTYHFSIDKGDVKDHLIPQEPTDRWVDDYKEQALKYTQELENLTLHYTDILEQIFLQTSGRAFFEQALHELKEKCHSAAWDSGSGRAKFEQKKCVLQFTNYACSYRSYYRSESWELIGRMKDIIRGISHFETGGFDHTPASLSRLLGRESDSGQCEFPDCKKIQSLRMFKNGRVDLKFTSEAYVLQFVDEYLKTIC